MTMNDYYDNQVKIYQMIHHIRMTQCKIYVIYGFEQYVYFLNYFI